MAKVCPSSCHLAQVTPNVTFLWTHNGKEQPPSTMSQPYGHVLKYSRPPPNAYVSSDSFFLFSLKSIMCDDPLHRWQSVGHRSQHGPLPALNLPLTPSSATSHTHRYTKDTTILQRFHNCLDLGDSCCIPAVSDCVCVCVWLPWLYAHVPLISHWRGGDILSDWPFKHTLPLHTGDFSPLQETSQRQITSRPSFERKLENDGKTGCKECSVHQEGK